MSCSSRIKTCATAVLAFMMIGLGSPHAQTVEPFKYTSAHIDTVVFTIVNDEDPDEKRLDDKKELESRAPGVIKKSLQEQGLQVVEDGRQQTTPGQFTLRTTVKYNPGNRALRWVGGMFGAGKGTIDIHMEAINPASGAVITSVDVQDVKRMGAFHGGNFYDFADSTLGDTVEELVEALSTRK